jgi:hypothetical protein
MAATCTNDQHDHTTAEDGEGGTLPDGQTVPMRCNDCGEPAHYDMTVEDYRHDKAGVACFLIPASDGCQVGAIMGRYDDLVRGNWSEAWDTLAAVALCEDGLYGAWGEVLDVAGALDIEMDDATRDKLHDAFLAYQTRLRDEAGPDRLAAHKAARG